MPFILDSYHDVFHRCDLAVPHNMSVQIQRNLDVAVSEDFGEYLIILWPLLYESGRKCGPERVTGKFLNPCFLADSFDLPVDAILTKQSPFR